MYWISVDPEPNDSRPVYRWRVHAPQLLATGIALTEIGARRQAHRAAEQTRVVLEGTLHSHRFNARRASVAPPRAASDA